MKTQQTEWQTFLGEYILAQEQYKAARAAAARHATTVDEMTAAFLAEEQARDRLVLVRHRLFRSAEQ